MVFLDAAGTCLILVKRDSPIPSATTMAACSMVPAPNSMIPDGTVLEFIDLTSYAGTPS
jgi:hypothetical protein